MLLALIDMKNDELNAQHITIDLLCSTKSKQIQECVLIHLYGKHLRNGFQLNSIFLQILLFLP